MKHNYMWNAGNIDFQMCICVHIQISVTFAQVHASGVKHCALAAGAARLCADDTQIYE